MESEIFHPPAHPPPLLAANQVLELARTGYLRLELPPPLHSCLKKLFRLDSEFFKQSMTCKNAQFPTAQGTELGYYHVEHEKEYLTFRHQYHDNASTSALSLASSEFWKLAAFFLHRILSNLSTALDIPLRVWDPLLDGCLSMPASGRETTPTLLRLFNYFPNAGAAEKHTDTGFLTLCVGTAPGLQVWSPPQAPAQQDGEWTHVGIQPIVLVGKTLQWLSAGRVRAGLHRVVPAEEGRQSVVFALRPSLKYPELDLTPFGEPATVNLVKVWKEIRGSLFNVNAHTKTREEQKELLRRRGWVGEPKNNDRSDHASNAS
ncbi:MAG: hypothetical protein Q9166_004688 [cf. Caloplaca sp. 2 TL-2023]